MSNLIFLRYFKCHWDFKCHFLKFHFLWFFLAHKYNCIFDLVVNELNHLLIVVTCSWILLGFLHTRSHLWRMTVLFLLFQFLQHFFPVLLCCLGPLVQWQMGILVLSPILMCTEGRGFQHFTVKHVSCRLLIYIPYHTKQILSLPNLIQVLLFFPKFYFSNI